MKRQGDHGPWGRVGRWRPAVIAALVAPALWSGSAGPAAAQEAPSAAPRPPAGVGAPAAPPEGGRAAGQDPHAEHQHPAPPVPPQASAGAPSDADAARRYFSDVVLLDQNGAERRFYSDLLAGKTVVINAFFTTCAGVCPVLSGKLAALQGRLGDRLGKDVFFVSLTVDPETDTPEKLREYAARFAARPGWSFVGGKKENVDWALYRVGQYVEDKEAHTNIFIVGNERTKLWKKVFGLAPIDELERIVTETADDGQG